MHNKTTQSKTFPGRGRSPPKILSRKERKEMEGGNGVSEANGITQFAEGEQNARSVHTKTTQPKTNSARERSSPKIISRKERKEMEGGNGVSASERNYAVRRNGEQNA